MPLQFIAHTLSPYLLDSRRNRSLPCPECLRRFVQFIDDGFGSLPIGFYRMLATSSAPTQFHIIFSVFGCSAFFCVCRIAAVFKKYFGVDSNFCFWIHWIGSALRSVFFFFWTGVALFWLSSCCSGVHGPDTLPHFRSRSLRRKKLSFFFCSGIPFQ